MCSVLLLPLLLLLLFCSAAASTYAAVVELCLPAVLHSCWTQLFGLQAAQHTICSGGSWSRACSALQL
jgi:hypothetical protein